MTNTISLKKLCVAVAIVTIALVIWLALAPAPRGHHDLPWVQTMHENMGSIAQVDARPSCTHTRNQHRHDNGIWTTFYESAHKHADGTHHHHGRYEIAFYGGGVYGSLYDRQCPKH